MVSRYFPSELVLYVAKTGFISKSTWKDFFFPGGTTRWKNAFWASLLDRGYFLRHPNPRLHDIYLLNRSSREVVEYMSGRCVRPPFISQINHDELLFRGILQLSKAGTIESWITESELKSFEQSTYKIESQGKGIKYPDSILVLKSESAKARLALEMEITQKDRRRYIQIMSAYSSMRGIESVIFIVGSKSIREVIESCLKEIYFPKDKIFVGFIDLKDWQNSASNSFANLIVSASPLSSFDQNSAIPTNFQPRIAN